MTTKNFASTKGLDELFIYAYKLRKAGIDPTIVETLSKSILVGAPSISFELSNPELTDDQKALVKLLKDNGFEVHQYNTTLVVKNIHLQNLRDSYDKYVETTH